MKLPKCPHCEKLMVGMIVNPAGRYEDAVVYLCPETCKPQDPDWVEVLEV